MRGLKEKQQIPPFHERKKANETEWIKTLSTLYPYRMNEKVGDETTTNNDELIDSKLPSLNVNILVLFEINTLKLL